MATLNIMCTICMEFYKPEHVVYVAINCGHLFHRSCLYRWLDQSKLCPQCRKQCPKYRTHRVYLNFTERTEIDDKLDLELQNMPDWVALEEFDIQNESGMPEGVVKCGTDPNGNQTYVARVYYHDDLLPANYCPTKLGAYAPWACKAHFLKEQVELLIMECDYKWVPAANGSVPEGAIVTGYSELHENLYTGRGQYAGLTLLGKLHPSHGVLYMPYNEQEVNVKEYEILVPIPKQPTA